GNMLANFSIGPKSPLGPGFTGPDGLGPPVQGLPPTRGKPPIAFQPPARGGPPADLPLSGRGPRGGPFPAKGLPRVERGNTYYFLWSLERVAVAFGLETIGNKDWYAWGTEFILTHQDANGGWEDYGHSGRVADTCFALLFLCRANLAKDLSASLRGK